MNKFILTLLAGAVLSTPSFGLAKNAHAFTDAEKTELGTIIESYILDNPEIVIKAYQKHQANEETRKREAAADVIKNNKKELTGKHLPSIGNPKADVTIVEFFDYNCGYCKKAIPDLERLLDSDKNVRIVFHEMPILSADSRKAALWALAAHKQDKYFDYHVALMRHRGAKNDNTLTKIGKDLGLDTDRLKRDAQSKDVEKMLNKSIDIARKVGVTGTPAFIVEDQFYGGYIGYPGLLSAIKDARKK